MKTRLPARLTLPVIFGVALATGFSGAVVPGSLLAVVVRESVRVGWQAGPLMMIGHGALELVAVVLLTTGLIKFARSDRARGLIGVIGGGVLLYLGYSTLGLSGEAAVEALRAGAAPSGGAGAWAPGSVLRLAALGALMSTVNPYWWLWWATIGVAHVGWATGGGSGIVRWGWPSPPGARSSHPPSGAASTSPARSSCWHWGRSSQWVAREGWWLPTPPAISPPSCPARTSLLCNTRPAGG